jgi:pSer/pThr/pTyr-binding forkhead associated (FHA) protein
MKLSLMVLSEGKAQGQAIPINFPQFVIGRDPQCHLRPVSAVISKRHCALLVKNGKVFVRDFDSTNGTFVNEDQVKGEQELHNDDLLKIGPLTFRVALEGAAPPSKPTPPPQRSEEASDDEQVAAMLLALQDDAIANPGTGQVDSDGVPQGTTVMDMMSPLTSTSEETSAADKTDDKKKQEPPKKDSGNTSSAAAAILQKYTRRNRA